MRARSVRNVGGAVELAPAAAREATGDSIINAPLGILAGRKWPRVSSLAGMFAAVPGPQVQRRIPPAPGPQIRAEPCVDRCTRHA